MFVGAKLSLRSVTSKKHIRFHWEVFSLITNVSKRIAEGAEFRSSSAYGGYVSEGCSWFRECKEWVGPCVDPVSHTRECGLTGHSKNINSKILALNDLSKYSAHSPFKNM